MILLLGGTTEAAPIAQTLAKAGFEVLLSTATAIPPHSGIDAGIRQRTGKLNAQGLADLIRSQGIRIVVDATHPYAAVISANAWTACQQTGVPYVAFDRPGSVADVRDIHWAADHDQAAALACSFGQPVLLTVGTQNLAPYVAAAKLHGTKLIARILDHPSSIEACSQLGLSVEEIVCAKGPFSVTENASLIIRHHIGVLVTKDSGDAGGVHTKITAAQDSGCRVVVVKRPPRPQAGYLSIPALMKAVRFSLASDVEGQP
jgi:precorrin-6A/cobalt-precorrin-6A reductase